MSDLAWLSGSAAEKLHQALRVLNPDPVDVFEDELADELGIQRPEGMSYRKWRRYRVEASEDDSRNTPVTVVKAQAALRIRRTKAR